MYVKCSACETSHNDLTIEEVRILVERFQAGDGQIVTPIGIRSKCVREIIGLPETQRSARMRMMNNGHLLSPV